ncbi:HAMP domain-containing histidine kinase [Dactylosporangium vinaceum]|uniref:histidine kinase n=1 Tax=Dactylosporangium vinaceum TaxID=53362 RepID=A0ABV5MA39_9ACTN|nr:HAMP domain-containing sensor histidine kinase [Dactylosporangium vinaceum]UAB93114.1 HAMP domain-containing histidine kinase [Dactylosporangium vinaceum]
MTRWWNRRTLRDRLAILVTGAVAVAVLTVAAVAFTAVFEIQHRQLQAQLTTDAQAIAAQPDQWRAGAGQLPDVDRGPGPPDGHGPPWHRPRDLGTRWQIVGADGAAVSDASSLPITTSVRQVLTGRRTSARETVVLNGERYQMLTIPAQGGGVVQVAISQDPAGGTLVQLSVLLALGSAVVITGAALLGRRLARTGLIPVSRLAEAVEDVAVTMDLTRPVPVHGVDEIARLGRSVNTMLGAIDASRRAQRTLVEDAGHELRTPLTSIRTNVELLLAVERRPELAHRLPPEERAKLLADLEAQVAELATLTTELVELSREETTREEPEPLDFADVVAAAVDRVRIRAPGQAFTTSLSPVPVHGRPGELERMVVNVLDNAAKWSPPGGTVAVHLAAGGTLTVTDHGPGIDEADRPHVFDRFYRATAARGLPGSGLGLAIVAQTAAQHGGTVAVAPNTPQGTVLTIRLPVQH